MQMIENVTVVPGAGAPRVEAACVVLDETGVVLDIQPGRVMPGRYLLPSAVDLHLDNLTERRRPRATVELDLAGVLASLDAECAAAGIGVVCVAARCEDAPGKGVHGRHAVETATMIEALSAQFACDWRLHVRVEVTDGKSVGLLRDVLAASNRVALISVMEHTAERSRFESAQAHREFYAADWGVSPQEVDRILAEQAQGTGDAQSRRQETASLARERGILLASHDDRTVEQVDQAHDLGARLAEFPLTPQAARRALELGMDTVLGAPNAVRGRSTSPGNILVRDAVREGLCTVLCSDYLPSSLTGAVLALAEHGVCRLEDAVDLAARSPARLIAAGERTIAPGRPLNAALVAVTEGTPVGLGLWRDGVRTYGRGAGGGNGSRPLARGKAGRVRFS